MSYVYVALGLGVLLIVFGVFVEKKKTVISSDENKKNNNNQPDTKQKENSYVHRDASKGELHEGMRKQSMAKAQDREQRANAAGMTIEELDARAEANKRKFLENAQGGRTLPQNKPLLKDDEMEFINNVSKIGLELRSDEAELSEEQMRVFANSYASSSWGWLISTAISFSDGGKMRLPFSTMYYISSRLNPVITVNGEIQVTNMFTLSEQATASLFSGKTFFIQDKSGAQKEVTEEIIRNATYSKTAEELISEYENQKKIIEQQNKTIEALKNLSNGVTQTQSNEAMMIEQKSKEDYEAIVAELNSKDKMIEKSKSVVLRLSEEVKRLSQENQQLSSKLSNPEPKKPNHPAEQQQNKPVQKTKPNNAQQKKEKSFEAEFDKNQTDAITGNGNSKKQANIQKQKRDIMNNSNSKNKELYNMLKNSALARIENGKRREYEKYTGLLAIIERKPGQGVYFYFAARKLLEFCRGWAESQNIVIDEKELKTKNFHMVLTKKELPVVGQMTEIVYPNLKIKTDSDIVVFDNDYAEKHSEDVNIKKSIAVLKRGVVKEVESYLEELLSE